MPEYIYPGVFVEEMSDTPREIAGTPTATAGFVGVAQKGPVDAPTAVHSISEYEATFGKISAVQPLPSGVQDFFLNGGSKAVIVRVGSDRPSERNRRLSDQLIGSAENKIGLHALSRLRERIGLLVVPNAAYLPEKEAAQLTKSAVAFSEAHGIFHIVDIPNAVAGKGPVAALQWSADSTVRSRNMAVFYPWLVGTGGDRKKEKIKPPSAIAAGVYARMDQAQGVWKSPSGQEATVIGVQGLAQNLNNADAEKLRNVSINPILKVAGTRIVLWGARTFAADNDADWQYISIRRLGLFLENSIRDGLAWVAFEPNSKSLWAQIRLEVSSFLHTAWRSGALQGARPQEAYFVRCDATTMTADDIAKGRITVTIGFAPLRPAEFVIIRILSAAQVA